MSEPCLRFRVATAEEDGTRSAGRIVLVERGAPAEEQERNPWAPSGREHYLSRADAEALFASLATALGRPRPVADVVREAIPHAEVATDRELLVRALLALRPEAGEQAPRWSLVRCALGHGSGVGTAICDALGIDADELVKQPLPEWLSAIEDLGDDEATDDDLEGT